MFTWLTDMPQWLRITLIGGSIAMAIATAISIATDMPQWLQITLIGVAAAMTIATAISNASYNRKRNCLMFKNTNQGGGKMRINEKCFKSIHIDLENKIFQINGKDFGTGTTELDIGFSDGKWHASKTTITHYFDIG